MVLVWGPPKNCVRVILEGVLRPNEMRGGRLTILERCGVRCANGRDRDALASVPAVSCGRNAVFVLILFFFSFSPLSIRIGNENVGGVAGSARLEDNHLHILSG